MSLTGLGDWLNANSAAVQAVATIVLVGVTAVYVYLMRQQVKTSRQDLEFTRRLAVASEAQVELLRADRDDERRAPLRQLTALAQSLLAHLQQLPGPGAEAERRADALIKNAVLPTDEDLQELRRLAVAVGPGVGQLARTATDNFGWLRPYHRAGRGLLTGMTILFTPEGVLRRPFRAAAPIAAYLLAAAVGLAAART